MESTNKRTPRPSQTISNIEVDPNTIAALDKMMSQYNDYEGNNTSNDDIKTSTYKTTSQRSIKINSTTNNKEKDNIHTLPSNIDANAVAELSNFKMTTVEDDPFDILVHKQLQHQSSSVPVSKLSSSISSSSLSPTSTNTYNLSDIPNVPSDDIGEEIRQRYLTANMKNSPLSASVNNKQQNNSPSSSSTTFNWENVKIGGTDNYASNNSNLNDASSHTEITNQQQHQELLSRIPTLSKATTSKPPTKSSTGKTVTNNNFSITSGGGKNLLDQLKLKDAEIDRLEAIILAMTPAEDSNNTNGLSAHRLLEVGNSRTKNNHKAIDDPRDAKIMELAKRNKALSMSLNKEKDKNQKLNTELQIYQTHQSSSTSSHAQKSSTNNNNNNNEGVSFNENNELSENITTSGNSSANNNAIIKSLQNSLAKAQRTAERATLELKATHRILQKEIGNDIPLNKILAAHGIVNSIVLGDLTSFVNNNNTGNTLTDNTPNMPTSPPMSAGGETITSRNRPYDSNQSVISSSASATGHVLSESGKPMNSNNTKFTPGDWRGRQQTITLLRTRIKTLERELIKLSTVSLTNSSLQQQQHSNLSSSTLSLPPIAEHEQSNISRSTPIKQQSTGIPPPPSVQLVINSETGAPADEAFGLGLDADEEPLSFDNHIAMNHHNNLPGSTNISNNSSPQGMPQASNIPNSSVLSVVSSQVPNSVSGSQIPPPFDVDDRAAAMLTARNNTKAMQIARLNEQLSGAKTDMERARMDAAAAKARNTILETELKKFKNHVKSLLSKTEMDDKLIETLRTEVKTIKQSLTDTQKKLSTVQLNSLPGETIHDKTHPTGSAGNEGSEAKTILALKQQIASLREELELQHPLNHTNTSLPVSQTNVSYTNTTNSNNNSPNNTKNIVNATNSNKIPLSKPKYIGQSIPNSMNSNNSNSFMNDSGNSSIHHSNQQPQQQPMYIPYSQAQALHNHSQQQPPPQQQQQQYMNNSNNQYIDNYNYSNYNENPSPNPYLSNNNSSSIPVQFIPPNHGVSHPQQAPMYHPSMDTMNNNNNVLVGSPGFRVIDNKVPYNYNNNPPPQPQYSSPSQQRTNIGGRKM